MKKAPIHGAFCVLLKTSDENKNLVVPTDWLEQTTYRLQGGCSTTELSGLTENLNSTHFFGFVLSPDLKK